MFKEQLQCCECKWWKQLDQLKKENETYKSSIVANLDKNISKRYRELLEENDQLKETIEGLLSIQYKLADNNKRLRQTLAEIKPILEYYENSKIGEIQEDGSYKLEWTFSEVTTPYCINYDPKPAREALRKINEVEDEKNM